MECSLSSFFIKSTFKTDILLKIKEKPFVKFPCLKSYLKIAKDFCISVAIGLRPSYGNILKTIIVAAMTIFQIRDHFIKDKKCLLASKVHLFHNQYCSNTSSLDSLEHHVEI